MQYNLLNAFSNFRIELFPVFCKQQAHCSFALYVL
jgi:hypothetical protein